MQAILTSDFSTVTEQPDQAATHLQLSMLSTRYAWAAGQSAGKDVAEVACGAGLGLGWIARMARTVEAGDLDELNCRIARETYAGREKIHISRIDALQLPFRDCSLDLLLLFEAIYYLPGAEEFLRQALRALRPGGTLLISTVNCEWAGFNPSPFHTRYFSAFELRDLLARAGFAVTIHVGFTERRSALDFVVACVRRVAVAARLIPKTMSGKAFLKRCFYGSLSQIPRELEPGRHATEPLHSAGPEMHFNRYRTLYAEARKVR